MSLLQQTRKVVFKQDIGVVSFVNSEGESKHVLYINKPKSIKREDFKEIMESMEIKFKKSK
jgi:hypothetical protein